MRFLFFSILFLIASSAFCQAPAKDSGVIIGDIIVTGNKKTKTNIILREMFFKKGDTLSPSDFATKLEQSRSFIFNTTLFVDVVMNAAKQDSGRTAVIIQVKERWYIFPLPYFKLVDRNFNDWWVNQNRDLSRVNYGIKFFHNNLSGNNDKLNLWLITGYSRQITISYDRPFSNKKMTNGFSIGYSFSQQKEVNYQTSDINKQVFYKMQDDFGKTSSRFSFAFTNRPSNKVRHIFKVGYSSEFIHDSVVLKNPDYYGNGTTRLNYVDFNYTLQYFNSNYNAYPTKGFNGSANFYTRPFNTESQFSQLTLSSVYALPINSKLFFRVRSAASIKFPYNNSFVNQSLFGYGDFLMRGMEYYVVDGMFGIINKMNLGYELFKLNLKLPVKSSTYKNIPIKFYPKIYTDFGYCYSPYNNNNFFNNKLLHTYGIGVDIVTIYDIVFKIEYSINQRGESGVFVGN